MSGVLFFLAILGVGAVGALAYFVNQQDQKNRYARLGAVACGVCGAEGVEERGGGSYRCGSCGYDTDAEQPPEKAALVSALQELGIARACLESARREFNESRERVRTYREDGRDRTEKVGPFHDRYLEGTEQANEALAILSRLVDRHAALGSALEALGSIDPPPEGKAGFNAQVNTSVSEVRRAEAVIDTQRRELVQRFRG